MQQLLQFLKFDVCITEGFRLFCSSSVVSSLCWSLCKDNFGKCLCREMHPVPGINCLEVNEDWPCFAALLVPAKGPDLQRCSCSTTGASLCCTISNTLQALMLITAGRWLQKAGMSFFKQKLQRTRYEHPRTTAVCFRLSNRSCNYGKPL